MFDATQQENTVLYYYPGEVREYKTFCVVSKPATGTAR